MKECLRAKQIRLSLRISFSASERMGYCSDFLGFLSFGNEGK